MTRGAGATTTRAGSASAATRTEAPSGRARSLGPPRPGKSGLPPSAEGGHVSGLWDILSGLTAPSAEGGALALRRARGWGTSETVPVKMGARSQARGGKPQFRAFECVRCCFRLLAAFSLRCSCLGARPGALGQEPFGEGTGGGGSGSSRSATPGLVGDSQGAVRVAQTHGTQRRPGASGGFAREVVTCQAMPHFASVITLSK